MNFNFLNDIKLATIQSAPKTKGGPAKINRIPEGLAIRVYKDGRVYPSDSAVEQFNLEYLNKDSEELQLGFDIVNSNNWTQYPSEAPSVLFLSPVAKTAPKVDLFGSVRYNEDGTPKNTVKEQASKNEDLLNAVQDIFGIVVEDYVDLQFITDNTLTVEVAYLPKTVARGPEKGQIKTERRENVVMYPMSLISIGEDELVTTEVVTEEETTSL
jgi:signal recognition particle subunit SEC65